MPPRRIQAPVYSDPRSQRTIVSIERVSCLAWIFFNCTSEFWDVSRLCSTRHRQWYRLTPTHWIPAQHCSTLTHRVLHTGVATDRASTAVSVVSVEGVEQCVQRKRAGWSGRGERRVGIPVQVHGAYTFVSRS